MKISSLSCTILAAKCDGNREGAERVDGGVGALQISTVVGLHLHAFHIYKTNSGSSKKKGVFYRTFLKYRTVENNRPHSGSILKREYLLSKL